ncbi:4F2 cell-surface antigen heavy chain [Orchesella cincta]|uniref:4F2 cell-surface antigen heavy chain n=1 Tax=Orchesella cincta TaxID=48709 RepID=A0A1D2NBU3_ORCCI|nr:4F2 cell-surface antigen heavy chain [Orchesella cincta]
MASGNKSPTQDVERLGDVPSTSVAGLSSLEGRSEKSSSSGVVDQMEIQSVPSFVGLGKEDLLELANRPFWVRLRWALFITFWLMWIGLLVGAALIIALSPGCEENTMKTSGTTIRTGHRR